VYPIHTVYDRIFGDFSAHHTVCTLIKWFWPTLHLCRINCVELIVFKIRNKLSFRATLYTVEAHICACLNMRTTHLCAFIQELNQKNSSGNILFIRVGHTA